MSETKVTFKSWDGEGKETFRKLIEEILHPAVNKPIIAYVPHGRPASPNTDTSCFVVYVWSSRNDHSDTTRLSHDILWGYRPGCTDSIYCDREEAYPIVSPEGCMVASCDKNNLYIHFDAVHRCRDDDVQIFRKILEEAAESIGRGFEVTPERSEEIYVKVCSQRINREKMRLRNDFESYEKEIKSNQKRIVQLIREHKLCRDRLEFIEKTGGEDEEFFRNEFRKLADISHVKKVMMISNSLYLRTDNITCVDPRTDTEHNMGEFVIKIDSGRGDVLFLNQSFSVDAYEDHMQAPHVFRHGNPCLGNLGKTLPELIAGYDLPTAVMVCIQFLESVNVEDSAGKHINRWPLKGETESEYTEKPNNIISIV